MQVDLVKIDQTDLCGPDWLKLVDRPELVSDGADPKPVKIVDLFSGCGGMTLGAFEGFRKNGFKIGVQLALDTNVNAVNVYKRNFELLNEEVYCGDINDLVGTGVTMSLSKKEFAVKARFKDLDLLLAGPPCQGHSNLNNYTRRQDPRNELYLNVVRFIKLTQPKVAVIENVSAVVHDESNTIEVSNHELSKAGYKVFNLMINTADYGVAQVRKRHLQVCVRQAYTLDFSLEPYRVKIHTPISEVISDLRREYRTKPSLFTTPSKSTPFNQARISFLFKTGQYDLPNDLRPACHKDKPHSYKSCYGRMHWSRPSQTITSGFGSIGQGRFIHPKEQRVITPHEAARIQGFPDFFGFDGVSSRTELHTMIANAVPPKILAIIIDSLAQKGIFD